MTKKRLTHGEKTKLFILSAGCEIWNTSPEKVNASEIARRLGIKHSAVLYHFPKDTIRDEVAKYAVKIADSHVIVQLIAINHPSVAKMSQRQKDTHIRIVKQPRLI